MIDTLLTLLSGALQAISVAVVVLVAISILTAAISTPQRHAITDDWERRKFGRSR